MKKKTLSLSKIEKLVKKNRYKTNDDNKFKARCIDGRYIGNNLPPLARPGGDAGSLMEMLAINDTLSLGLKNAEVANRLVAIVGGYERFHFHTDMHHPTKIIGCGHIKEVLQNHTSYGLTIVSVTFLQDFLNTITEKGASITILNGDHTEGALLIVKGEDWSVEPDNKIFVYHKTLDDQRRKLIAHQMIQYIDPKLQVEEEYLYDMLSQISDNQRMETVKRLAEGLPIYEVVFEKNGKHEIEKI